MNLFNYWETWVVLYLISAVLFAQSFKIANRNMKNANCLTVLLEIFTAFFAIFFIPFFPVSFPNNISIYLTLLIVTIIYAVTDRLNIESRYGLEPSTFSMLKQLSTVFMIFFGFVLLKEPFAIKKLMGAVIIVFSNLLLAYEKGKLTFNKYFIMCIISNFLFAVGMLINVNISDNFNLAIYTILTVSVPALIISLFGKLKPSKLKTEFNLYNKKAFLIASFSWCLMLISSVRAYQLGNVIIIASLFALTSIFNSAIDYMFNKDKRKLAKNLIAALLLIIGVILVKI